MFKLNFKENVVLALRDRADERGCAESTDIDGHQDARHLPAFLLALELAAVSFSCGGNKQHAVLTACYFVVRTF